MQHECKITVLETKVFPELQEKYLADPKSGPDTEYIVFNDIAALASASAQNQWLFGRERLRKNG